MEWISFLSNIVWFALLLWGLALAVVYGAPVAKALKVKYKDAVREIKEWEIENKLRDAILYAEEWGRKFGKKGQDKFDKAVAHAQRELVKFQISVEETKDRIVSKLADMRSEIGSGVISVGEKVAGK